MARGWESKAVEAQQDEATRQRPSGSRRSPEALALADRRRTLELSRSRVAADLARATAAQHRRMLEHALATLDEQLAALGG